MFMEELGLQTSGLDLLIQRSYALLGLISFLTAGSDECRAWTIRKGTKAPQAAGKIHTDFERGFIRAEVVAFDDLQVCQTLAAARAKGLLRSEGKEYVIQDGDVVNFLFDLEYRQQNRRRCGKKEENKAPASAAVTAGPGDLCGRLRTLLRSLAGLEFFGLFSRRGGCRTGCVGDRLYKGCFQRAVLALGALYVFAAVSLAAGQMGKQAANFWDLEISLWQSAVGGGLLSAV